MTFLIYWEKLQAKNGGLSDHENKMTISVSNFKKALEQAYDMGFEHGKDVTKLTKDVTNAGENQAFNDLFGSIFGRK